MANKLLSRFFFASLALAFSFFSSLNANEGPQLRFEVNVTYLIHYTLVSTEEYGFSKNAGEEFKATVLSFQNYLKNNCPEEFKIFLDLHKDAEGEIDECLVQTERMQFEGADLFYRVAEESPSFQKLLQETQEYAVQTRKQWESNYAITLCKVSEIVGDIWHGKEITVNITHPKLANRQTFDETHIAWGHRELWPSYTTVYLWHEILHTYFWDPKYHCYVMHCLIQFITDNELRVFFVGGSYPPLEGHRYLDPLMHQLLPYWNEYLATKVSDRNFDGLIEKLMQLFPREDD